MLKIDPQDIEYPLLEAKKCKWNLLLHAQLSIFFREVLIEYTKEYFGHPVTCLLYSYFFMIDVSALIIIFLNKIVWNRLWINDALESCHFPKIQI